MSLSSEIQINKIEFVFETCITQSLRKVKAWKFSIKNTGIIQILIKLKIFLIEKFLIQWIALIVPMLVFPITHDYVKNIEWKINHKENVHNCI